MSLKENIFEIKPMKIDINDIFDKKIELAPLLEFNLLQKIIEEFINRQNETNNKINELEKKINYIKNMSSISQTNNYSPKDNNMFNNINFESFEENDLNEKEDENEENKQNEEKEEKEKNEQDNLDKDNINKEENKTKTLLQSSKNESKKTKFLFQQVLSKVNILENKHNELLEQFNSNNKEHKKEVQSLKNKNKENTTKISELENMIKEMQNKKEEELDEMKIINDDEDNIEIDQDKVKTWIKNLEQKLTKKIEFSDKRNKNNEGALNGLKNEINDLKNKLNNLESMLSSPNEKEKEEEDKNEQVDEEKKEGRNIFDDLAKKEELNKLKLEFQQKIDEVNDNISKNPLLNLDEKKLYESIIPKLGQMTQNLKENVQKSIENNEKYVKNQIKKIDIDSIKAEMASMKNELKNKLNKENLGSINLKIEDMENIEENLRTLIDDNRNDIRQCNDKYAKIFKVLETLRGQVLSLFDDEESRNKKDTDESKLDLALLVSRLDYNEDKEKMNKKIEKIYLQETDNYRIIQEIQRKIRNLVTETDLQNVEQYLLNILNENKIKMSKTYVEKMELQKSLKFLELRIKSLEETASKENENWLLAKKPINGFLCASCEAYIGDLKNNEEIATWNKLSNKKDRKNYRIGHGFSTMLKMLNTDLLKRLEKEKEKENINNHSVINNNHAFKQDDIKKINKNLPKINLTNQININETQNMKMNMNNSHSEEINEHLNNSSNNLNSHTQINFERNFLNIKGQLTDRAINANKNANINNFNKDIIDNMTNEEIHPKVIKIAKKSKKA